MQEEKKKEDIAKEEDSLKKENEEIQEVEKEKEEIEGAKAFEMKERKPHEEVVEVVDASKILIESVEKEIQEAMNKLNEDIAKLEELEEEVLTTTLKEADELLKSVGYEESLADVNIAHPVFEYDKKDALPQIKRPSSGKFSAFVLGLLGGALTAGAIGYAAMSKLNMALDKLPTKEQIAEILKWVSQQVGAGANETVGGAVVGAAAFVVFLIIYKIKVSMKVRKNIKLAEEIKEEAYKHKSKREERKEEILKTDELINKTRDVLDKLNVLLQEYNAKIKRILHFEKGKSFDELHEKSKNDIEDAFNLAREIKLIIVTPESSNGELNPESLEVLKNSEILLNKMIQKLY